jgi:hypothetical protein
MRLSEITESSVDLPPGYSQDNPGGSWLKSKQADAEGWAKRNRSSEAQKMLGGSQTAWAYGVMLPTEWLSRVQGALDERRVPGDAKFDSLSLSVIRQGWKQVSQIMVMINHRGVPYIWEGNTRIAVAKARGIPAVRAEVRWLNGAEEVDGPATPAKVGAMHKTALVAMKAWPGLEEAKHPRENEDADLWKEGYCHALALALHEQRNYPLMALKIRKGRSIIVAHIMALMNGSPDDEGATYLDVEGQRHAPDILHETEWEPEDEWWVETVTPQMLRRSKRLAKITPELAARAREVALRLLAAEGL